MYTVTNGNFGTDVIARKMYQEMFTPPSNFGRASAVAIVLLLAIIPFMASTSDASASRRRSDDGRHASPSTRRGTVRRAAPAAVTRSRLALHVIVIGLMVIWIVPTLGLLINSFRPASEVASSGWWTALFPPWDFTLDNYARRPRRATTSATRSSTACSSRSRRRSSR